LILDRNLDIVHFTISAHNRELYKIVHGGDHFDDAIKTLETFLDKRYRNQLIEVHTVITKHNAPYLQEWWDFFGKYPNITRRISPLVASYDNLPSKLALGDLTLDKQEEMIIKVGGPQFRMWTRALIPDEQPCNLWHNLAFDVEGYFLQCCNWSPPDEVNYGKIDDFIEEGRTLKEVWTERLANRMRNKLCRSCNMKHPEYVKRLAAMRIDLP
jgi:radical SAM protein with 4Fe4S-binding SPASM domain